MVGSPASEPWDFSDPFLTCDAWRGELLLTEDSVKVVSCFSCVGIPQKPFAQVLEVDEEESAEGQLVLPLT